jgi:hypothetical protein
LVIEQALRELEEQRRMAQIACVLRGSGPLPSPMMPEFRVIDGTNQIGCQHKMESSLKSAVSLSSGSSTR